jgi:hypothetical protein
VPVGLQSDMRAWRIIGPRGDNVGGVSPQQRAHRLNCEIIRNPNVDAD